jgi:peptidoglycan/xylan/chitin deacetylase (PgdA/CDA1 family)
MNPARFCDRLHRAMQRRLALHFARRPFVLSHPEPIVSFTFDDFPRSALFTGGRILEEAGARGTYYTSFGLMGQAAPTGEIFTREDFPLLLERGHELGCHTFAHFHAGDTPSDVFEASIEKNREALRAFCPSAEFTTHSYPIGNPRVGTKTRCGKHFLACRGGGQTYNSGTTDLNYLKAFFIEQSVDDIPSIERQIDENARAKGWLIFATHDISDSPTRYGCTPALFEHIVKKAATSARILPVTEALTALGVGKSKSKKGT